MVTTSQILISLMAVLKDAALVEKVVSHTDANLQSAMAALRDTPGSLVVVVPGEDECLHHFDGIDDMPARSEIRTSFDVLISGRQLDGRQTADPKTLDLKDAVMDLLMWHDLSLPNFICLPETCKPMVLEFDSGRNREAWHLVLKGRQLIPG